MKRAEAQRLPAAYIAGLSAMTGDFIVTILLAFFYPGYDHFHLVMSELGTQQSPVALWVNLWWILGGCLFFPFALALRAAFAHRKKAAAAVMILILIFGVFAWVLGGVFPMEPGGVETTLSGKLHGIFGGLGYLALLLVPLVSIPLAKDQFGKPGLWAAWLVFLAGLISFGLFISSENGPASGLLSLPGLWQRVFLGLNYAYLAGLGRKMLSKRSTG